MPNYTYKCPDGHITERRTTYEDFVSWIKCHERDEFGDSCGWSAGVVFEPTPFMIKAPRDTR